MRAEDWGVRKDRFACCQCPWLSRELDSDVTGTVGTFPAEIPFMMAAASSRSVAFKGGFCPSRPALPTQFALSHSVPHRELAVLQCYKSDAFCSLRKWDEAFVAAKECLRWDPTCGKVW